MKAIQKYPQAQYPYLAIWTGPDNYLEKKTPYKVEEIVIISMVQEKQGEDLKPYVQPLMGGKQGHFTQNEEEYSPLPNGYEVTLVQAEEDE